jgi:hypothetical protein
MAKPPARRGRGTEALPVLSQRTLNRTLLERQRLIERSAGSIVDAVEQVGGLQTQYAPSGYVGLWTRVASFRRGDLTTALEQRSLIQASLMRTTIHIVSRREYWLFANGIRRSRQEWVQRLGTLPPERRLRSNADRLREALADGPRTVKELGEWAKGFVGTLGLWVDLVRVPPSGTWERRRADRLALAETWVGPNDSTEAEGLEHLVRAYLRAFGPAGWKDIGSWAGLSVADVKRGAEELELTRYRDARGAELVDLSSLEPASEDAPAPVRFLPHWDANLLVHARRAGLLPEAHRPRVFSTKNPFSVGVYLVDGRAVGAWSLVDRRIVLDPFESISTADERLVEREREALEAFHA